MSKPDPTSPAGMTKPAIKMELLDEHGWSHDEVRQLLTKVACEQALIEARALTELGEDLDHEREPDPVEQAEDEEDDFDDLAEFDEDWTDEVDAATLHDLETVAAASESDTDDLDAFMDEIDAEREAALAALPPPLFIGMPDTRDYIFDGHAGAGPSGAERWMTCTASLGASKRFLETLTPNQAEAFANSSTAARQGTTAHGVAEAEINLRLGNISVDEYDNEILEWSMNPADGEEYTTEMDEYVAEYVAFVQTYVDAGHEVLVEARVGALVPLTVPLADGSEFYEIRGSVDAGILPTTEHNVLTAVDLKYGEGINVDVVGNYQVRIYMLGLLQMLADDEGNLPDLDRLDYVIAQPRLGGIKEWSETIDSLLDWRDEVLSPALSDALGLTGNHEYTPSEKACQWCPIQGSCGPLAESSIAKAQDLFSEVTDAEIDGDVIDAGGISNERIGDLLAQAESIVALAKDLKAEVQRRLYRGVVVPGYQLVNYTPPRGWKEGALEALVEEADLVDMVKEPTLHTPKTALEKYKKDADAVAEIEKWIVTPDKRPVAAREGDNRKTWEGRAPEDMFPDEIGDE